MKVPLGWLREYVELPADARAVAKILATLGFPVAAIEERPAITGVAIGTIAAIEKHPNADRLLVGRINVGYGQLLTIATAATNVAAGQTIAVATIGAQLPQLTIERRKMRGVESQGMMISAGELALPPDWFEDGIMQFDEGIAPGTDVIEYFRLNEAVLDVEVTSNRVDAMCVIGLARELAAYQGVPLRMPDMENPGAGNTTGDATLQPAVTLESPDCRRFVAQLFTNVEAGPSPAWMRIRLALCGQRPINRLVDVSNYVMLETGQPLHFYDADKIPEHRLFVRDALEGERLISLDGVERQLTAQALVIASESRAECLAGLMGAQSSEVTAQTRSLILEAANFNGARIRRTAQRLGFRTEASSRHEKNLAPALTGVGAARAAQLLVQFGANAGRPQVFGADVSAHERIELRIGDVRRLLGFELTGAEIGDLLDRLGFEVRPGESGSLLVTPPAWRTDVSVAADVVEEVARMAGYDRIVAEIPAVRSHAISSEPYRRERAIALTLAGLGYREIVTYSLHGARVFEKLARAGMKSVEPPVEVLNPLSEDQRYLRDSLLPGFLEHLARSPETPRIFEIGHVFAAHDREPLEDGALVFGFTAAPLEEPVWRDTHFLRIKGDCEALVRVLTGRSPLETAPDERSGLHPGKTGILLFEGREVAVAGMLDPRLSLAFEIDRPVYVASMRLRDLPGYEIPQFVAPSRYPSTYRDLAVVCGIETPAQRLELAIARAIGGLCTSVRSFDEYRGPQIPAEKKSLAIRIMLQKRDATITDPEADAAIAKAVHALRDEFDATLRE